MRVRVKSGTHHRDGYGKAPDQRFEPGDEFECTDAEWAAFNNKFEKIGGTAPNPEPEAVLRKRGKR